jgi:hypothetical protein
LQQGLPIPLTGQLDRIRRTGVALSRAGTHLSVSVPVFDDAKPTASLEVIAVLPVDPNLLIAPVRSAGEQVSKATTPQTAAS